MTAKRVALMLFPISAVALVLGVAGYIYMNGLFVFFWIGIASLLAAVLSSVLAAWGKKRQPAAHD